MEKAHPSEIECNRKETQKEQEYTSSTLDQAVDAKTHTRTTSCNAKTPTSPFALVSSMP